MDYRSIRVTLDDGLGRITLCAAERGNPIDEVFAAEFRDVAERFHRNPDVRAVLIDAEGRRFSVGGDLKRLARDRAALPSFVGRMMKDLCHGIELFAKGDAPLVACVHGATAGGSVGLVSGCDIICASPEASFVSAFSSIGLCADSGGSFYVTRRVGAVAAKQFFLLGEAWDAETARGHGLVDKVFPADELAASAEAIARKLAAGPTLGLGETRRLIDASWNNSLSQQLALEAAAIGRLLTTEDACDGISALVEKRRPAFRGR
ncbi:MAG: enoyl-CoA hydratase-related protein [Mesorhizobium sp.]|nr:enoyl-CoA hydratase-related protein [Mesorhizobium sp.]MCO5161285.1 enoyl-CoA hydratase-related protein [Mesorhizobium sp.]